MSNTFRVHSFKNIKTRETELSPITGSFLSFPSDNINLPLQEETGLAHWLNRTHLLFAPANILLSSLLPNVVQTFEECELRAVLPLETGRLQL